MARETVSAAMQPPNLDFQPLNFTGRYYTDTAKSAIEGVSHIAEEAASNEDEAISKRARRDRTPDQGKIVFRYDPAAMELTVTGDGAGMTAVDMQARLGNVGEAPEEDARRGYFNRGIREVFLALGGGTVTSIGRTADGADVLSRAIFDANPQVGMALDIQDREPGAGDRAELGLVGTGTRVTIPLARWAKHPRRLEFSSMESQIKNSVGLRLVLADPDREVTLEYGDTPPRRLRFEYPDGEDLINLREIEIGGQRGTFWAKVADKPIKGTGRRIRGSGILIRGERAAYEICLGDRLKSQPAMARVFGELRLDGIERLQRLADDASLLIYKTDRSGLNPEHPLVEAIYAFVDETLAPVVEGLDAGEKTPVSSDMRRQLHKLAREINQVIKEGVGIAQNPAGDPKPHSETDGSGEPPAPPETHERYVEDGIDFAHDRIFIDAGTTRTVKVWFDTGKVPAGTVAAVSSRPDDLVERAVLSDGVVPEPADDGIAELSLILTAGNVEGRHAVIVAAGAYTATLPVHVRFPRASGFISSIVLDDQDWELGSALWNPSTGVVTVYVGRPEFKDAETAAAGDRHYAKRQHPLYLQLIAESVREAALWEAAKRRAEVDWDDLSVEERQDPDAFFRQVRFQFQEFDYLLRAKLLKVFVAR